LVAAVAGLGEGAAAMEERNLVFLEQIKDAVIILLDDAILALEHLRQIQRQARHTDAMLGKGMPGMFVVLGRLQQCLGRNAADVGAGAARRRAALFILPVV